MRPALFLRLGRRPKFVDKPLLHNRMGPSQGVGNGVHAHIVPEFRKCFAGEIKQLANSNWPKQERGIYRRGRRVRRGNFGEFKTRNDKSAPDLCRAISASSTFSAVKRFGQLPIAICFLPLATISPYAEAHPLE